MALGGGSATPKGQPSKKKKKKKSLLWPFGGGFGHPQYFPPNFLIFFRLRNSKSMGITCDTPPRRIRKRCKHFKQGDVDCC
jgi:hypothetical protein